MADLTTTPTAVATGVATIPEIKKRVQHLGQALTEMTTSKGDLKSETERDELVAMLAPFLTIATEKQINGRITRLLINPAYKRADVSRKEMVLVIADWCVALAEFPYWAIELACRWWISADNPRCSYYPTAGEIGRRAKVEMDNVFRCKGAISTFDFKARMEAKSKRMWEASKANDARLAEEAEQKERDRQLAVLNGTHKRQIPKGVAAQLKYLMAAADEARGRNQPVSSEIKNRINAFYEKHPDLDPNLARNRGKSASMSPSEQDMGERCPPTHESPTPPRPRGHVGKSVRKVVKQVTEARNKAG